MKLYRRPNRGNKTLSVCISIYMYIHLLTTLYSKCNNGPWAKGMITTST